MHKPQSAQPPLAGSGIVLASVHHEPLFFWASGHKIDWKISLYLVIETRCLLWLSGTVLWQRNPNLVCEESRAEVWGERPPPTQLGTLTQMSCQQDVNCKLHTQKKTEKDSFYDCQTWFWTTGSMVLTIKKGIKTVGIPRWHIKIVSSTFWV